MAQSSDAVPFEMDDERSDLAAADITCPECDTESISAFTDRYSNYEYCTNCDWSDEEDADTAMIEPISRRDHGLNAA